MADLFAVVRADRRIPGGLRIVGRPTRTEEEAKKVAAWYSTPHDVLPLSEVYARRTAALDEESA